MSKSDAATASLADTAGSHLPRSIYPYIWQISRRHQVALAVLSVLVFASSMAPLELQRRIVNDAIRGSAFEQVALLCAAYAGVALLMGALKLGVNLYRGYLAEAATRSLRRSAYALASNIPMNRGQSQAQGIELALVISEVEPVGSFVGISVSEPLLQGGILITVFGYALFLQPWMALVCLALYLPQLIFVPMMQAAINRRATARINVMRDVSTGLINDSGHHVGRVIPASFERRISRVFDLNMQIFWWKFTMNFLMNALYHFGIVGVLLVGGWFVVSGRTEMGTVVAFISGLVQINAAWDDLVNYFRECTSVQVKYGLIATALSEMVPGMPPAPTALQNT